MVLLEDELAEQLEENLDEATNYFEEEGFETEWYRISIGSDESYGYSFEETREKIEHNSVWAQVKLHNENVPEVDMFYSFHINPEKGGISVIELSNLENEDLSKDFENYAEQLEQKLGYKVRLE